MWKYTTMYTSLHCPDSLLQRSTLVLLQLCFMFFFAGEQRTELEQGESDTHREHLEGCWGFQHDDDDGGGEGGGDDDNGV